MLESNRNIKLQKRKLVMQRIEQIPAPQMLNYLIIFGSSFVYLFFLISFLQFSRFDFSIPEADQFSKFFSVAAIVLTTSLIFSTRIHDAYLQDKVKQLRVILSSLLLIGLVFIIAQSLAWLDLLNMEASITTARFQSYLFIFSGIHALHMVAAVVMLGFLFYRISVVEGDPIKSIILLTNPYEKVKLDIFISFWHYIIISWMLIYALFLIVF